MPQGGLYLILWLLSSSDRKYGAILERFFASPQIRQTGSWCRALHESQVPGLAKRTQDIDSSNAEAVVLAGFADFFH